MESKLWTALVPAEEINLEKLRQEILDLADNIPTELHLNTIRQIEVERACYIQKGEDWFIEVDTNISDEDSPLTFPVSGLSIGNFYPQGAGDFGAFDKEALPGIVECLSSFVDMLEMKLETAKAQLISAKDEMRNKA